MLKRRAKVKYHWINFQIILKWVIVKPNLESIYKIVQDIFEKKIKLKFLIFSFKNNILQCISYGFYQITRANINMNETCQI